MLFRSQSLVGSRGVTFTTCRLLDPGQILLRLPNTPKQRGYRPGGWAVTCAVLQTVTSCVPIRSAEAPGDGSGRCSENGHNGKWDAETSGQVCSFDTWANKGCQPHSDNIKNSSSQWWSISSVTSAEPCTLLMCITSLSSSKNPTR